MNRINVTKPFLPPLEEFLPYLEKIWESKQLTNGGPFHQEFEQTLAKFLGVNHISLFTNGTLALVTALQALRIRGEVITTPFSFAATTHALWWNNIKPVFVDIEPDTFNLDPAKIESAITPETTAILGVHVYGNPCKVNEIEKIADTYGLQVIYDACHAFAVKLRNESILKFGDISILSFHATKVFNTFEGGAIICKDEKTKKRIDYLKNFGFADETMIVTPGINAKMGEFQAGLGLLQLNYVEEIIEKRKNIALRYKNELKNVDGVSFIDDIPDIKHNYQYFPIFINTDGYGKSRDEVYEKLKERNIYSRRYFYPLISQFPAYRDLDSAKPGKMPVAERVALEVLCLPMYPDLEEESQSLIIDLIREK